MNGPNIIIKTAFLRYIDSLTDYKSNTNLMKTSKLLLVFFILFLASCSSDDNNPGTELSPEELLVGKWYLTNATTNGTEVNLEDCQLFSFIEFLNEEDILTEWYESNCSSSGLKTVTYTFQSNPTGISISGDTGFSMNPDYEILKLTSTELILRTFDASQTTLIWERED